MQFYGDNFFAIRGLGRLRWEALLFSFEVRLGGLLAQRGLFVPKDKATASLREALASRVRTFWTVHQEVFLIALPRL